MIPEITSYMRGCAIKSVKKLTGYYLGQNITTKFFCNDTGEIVATLQSLKYSPKKGQTISQSLLQTPDGLTKFTEHVIDMIKLKQFKGKKNVKFPFSISSSVEYGDTASKKSFFFIKECGGFDKTDKDGLMIYKAGRNFKTDKVKIISGT